MENFNQFLDSFMTGDYFIVFIVFMLAILLVLVLALIKTRNDYMVMVKRELERTRELDELSKIVPATPVEEEQDILDDLDFLKATDEDDAIDENKPLIKQIDLASVKTYESIIEDYENSEEENAVISADELLRRSKERMEELGVSDNQAAIQKYEEEQEKKAIISYEQLLKNASNITLSYKEEMNKSGAPKINKIEIKEKEVTQAISYLDEEEFLNILKEFRLSLE